MKTITTLLFSIFCFSTMLAGNDTATPAGKRNPVLPGFHADPEILYAEKTGRYYIYSTTDGNPGWSGTYYQCFSSENLRDWRDEGIALDVKEQVSWANGNAWAPAIEEVKQKDGTYRYYLYFSGNNPISKRKEIGVAVSDSPTGPFVDSGKPIVTDAQRPKAAKGGQAIDVDVFTDPVSGKHYLYWGNGFMAGAELNDDMLSIKEETIVLMTPEGGTLKDWSYREAPYAFYRNGLYYFCWSVDDTGSPNYHIAYGTCATPLGKIMVAENPVILIERPEDEIYGTGHNSIIRLPKGKRDENGKKIKKDDWRIVYHRINKNHLKNDPGNHRETCIDKMTFQKDGTIQPVYPTK